MSQLDLANRIGASSKTVNRYESGQSTPHPSGRKALANGLEWSMAELALALSHEVRNGVVGHKVPSTLTMFASLEQAATELRCWEPVVIPGLLQTESYACAVEAIGTEDVPPDEIARRVAQRIERQRVLDSLRLFALIDASTLRRETGGPAVMDAQLAHLRSMAERPNVAVRVLPLCERAHAGARGAFTLLTADGPDPFMACCEDLAGIRYIETPTVVAAHSALWAYLWEVGLDVEKVEL